MNVDQRTLQKRIVKKIIHETIMVLAKFLFNSNGNFYLEIKNLVG